MFWIFWIFNFKTESHVPVGSSFSISRPNFSGFPYLQGIKHTCWELSAFRESRTGMGPAESMLEIYFLKLWRILYMASLGTVESRMIKQARTHVQVKDRVRVRVLPWTTLCMFYLIWCLSFGLDWFAIYNFLFFLKCYRSYIWQRASDHPLSSKPCIMYVFFKKIGKIYLQFWNSEFYFIKESGRKERRKRRPSN